MASIDTLRADIDAGRTRDKVRGADPAAAPLGTDEEAAGTPLSCHRVEMARSNEVDAPAPSGEQGGLLFYFLAIATISVVLIGAVYLLR
jgi:hypothetical protein